MKVAITGASNFINRMYESCGPFQWAREFLKNSLEAKATRIEFGIEWSAVEKFGDYRRTIVDNGVGMTQDELLAFFSTLGLGAKKIGGIHDNFGVGAKIAALPWNPNGVVVISRKNGKASMIKIVLDRGTGDYELVEFESGSSFSCVVDPSQVSWPDGDIQWDKITPKWALDHGTMIVLLGSENNKDTILGTQGAEENGVRGLSGYLNSRFWDLSSSKVSVVTVRSSQKTAWPKKRSNRDGYNFRTAYGAKKYVQFKEGELGKLAHEGDLSLDKSRVPAHWYLWEGVRPDIHSFAKETGFIAVKYKDELFQLTQNKAIFRAFGIIDTPIQRNLTIILEPKHYVPTNGRWGIHPDQSRNRLTFTGNGQKGAELPLYDWGQEFSNHMPEEILAAISKIRSETSGSIQDESYKNRLQDKFGDRWNAPVIKTDPSKASERTGTPDPTTPQGGATEVTKPRPTTQPHDITKMSIKAKELPAGGTRVREEKKKGDIPGYRYCGKDEFERPWHNLIWAPNDPKGPTVLVNRDSEVIAQTIKYHIDQYPSVHSEEIQRIVFEAYGEIAVSIIAHSQKLSSAIAKEVVDADYRSEEALTIALMGYLAADAVIAPRLLKLGRKLHLVPMPEEGDATPPTEERSSV